MVAGQSTEPWQVQEATYPANGNIEEQATFLLRYAILAPSTHNSQPWAFAIGDGTIHVFAADAQWLEVADADPRELYFSASAA